MLSSTVRFLAKRSPAPGKSLAGLKFARFRIAGRNLFMLPALLHCDNRLPAVGGAGGGGTTIAQQAAGRQRPTARKPCKSEPSSL
jgi:hypothetical protein